MYNLFPYLLNSATGAPDEWGFNPGSSLWAMAEASSGLLTVTQSRGEGFEQYDAFLSGINALGPQTWLHPPFGPDVPEDVRSAFSGTEQLNYWDMVHSSATLTVDALESLVKAAEAMMNDGLSCRIVGPYRNHTMYLDYLRRLKFDGVSGTVAFDEQGDRLSDFVVYNLHFDPSTIGRDRMGSVNSTAVMYWRLNPPEGQPALVDADGAYVQWRDGSTSPESPPPSDFIAEPFSDEQSPARIWTPLSIAGIVSLALVLTAMLAVSLLAVWFRHHQSPKSNDQQLRSGVLSSDLLDIEKRNPVYCDALWTELDGVFMMRDVSVHIPCASVLAPDRAILLVASPPLSNCPINGMILVHSIAGGSESCVAPPQTTRQAVGVLQGKSMKLLAVPPLGGSSHGLSTEVFYTSIKSVGVSNVLEEDPGVIPEVPAMNVISCTPITVFNASPVRRVSVRSSSSSGESEASRLSQSRITSGSTGALSDSADVAVDIETGMGIRSTISENQAVGQFHGSSQGNLRVKAKRRSRSIISGHTKMPVFEKLKDQVQRLIKLRSSRLQQVLGISHVTLMDSQPAAAVITEKIPGGNLNNLVHHSGTPLDLDVRVQILLDIAKGLACLHSQEPPIVHPGISMYNVLLQDDMRAVLSCYGFDAVAGATLGGLLQYAAPEVLAGTAPTPCSDVYSWAMLATELLERQRLHEDRDAASVLSGVRDGWLRPELSPNHDVTLVDLVVECSAKNPKRRPTTPELVQRLQDYQWELKSQAARQASDGTANELLNSIFPSDVAKQLAKGKRVVRPLIIPFCMIC